MDILKIAPLVACVLAGQACMPDREQKIAAGAPENKEFENQDFAADESETAEALADLKRMSEFLAQQSSLSFEAEVNFDVVQPAGHKLEFGSNRKLTVRRPDRAYVAVRQREGLEQYLYFDGTTLSASIPIDDTYTYASEKLPGTVAAALDALVEDIGVPAPLGDLIHPSLYAEVADEVESGSWVGEELLAGVPCDHLVFRLPNVDFQLWIEQGERPLPARLVITYRNNEGAPQFRARLHHWNLDAETPEALFTFNPPADAVRVPFPQLLEPTAPETAGE
jgi:hypothetical protein